LLVIAAKLADGQRNKALLPANLLLMNAKLADAQIP
jgi:hypothetical protein